MTDKHVIVSCADSLLIEIVKNKRVPIENVDKLKMKQQSIDILLVFIATRDREGIIALECKVKDLKDDEIVLSDILRGGQINTLTLQSIERQCELFRSLKEFLVKKCRKDNKIMKYWGSINEVDYRKVEKRFNFNSDEVKELEQKIKAEYKIDSLKNRIIEILEFKKQVILYGPPGTGKTYLAKEIVKDYVEKNKNKYFGDFPRVIVFVEFIKQVENKKDYYEYTHIATIKSNKKDIYEKINTDELYLIHDKSKKSLIGIFECVDKTLKAKKREIELYLKCFKEFSISEHDLPMLIDLKTSEIKMQPYKELNRDEIETLQEYIINKEFLKQFFITFHPSYSYEEFIEGVRLVTNERGNIQYEVREGIFKKICRMAYNTLLEYCGIDKKWFENEDLPELTDNERKIIQGKLNDAPKFFLIIDEINRGDLARVFGELISLIEADKRLFCENEIISMLLYSGKKFGVPPNLYIIATMNTADKSLALIDVALRRRFGFVEIPPATTDSEWIEWLKTEIINSNDSLETKNLKELAINILKNLNNKIIKEYDKDHQIGHSYLFSLKKCKDRKETIKTLKKIWYHEILPLLEEYFYDNPQKLRKILNNQFMRKESQTVIFEYYDDDEFLSRLEEVLRESYEVF